MKLVNKATTAKRVYNNHGILELLRQTAMFLRGIGHNKKLQFIHGEGAPNPNKIIYVSPSQIKYGTAKEYLPRLPPNNGVLDGEWDLHKRPFLTGPLTNGLYERFDAEEDWDDTIYYTTAIDRLRRGEQVNRFPGTTEEEFMEYLDSLDALFESLRSEGFNFGYPIELNIGRSGELMVHHGNHRTTMSKILDIDEISAKVLYRHEKWQTIRNAYAEANSVLDLPLELRKYIDHPDLAEFNIVEGNIA